jgi:hypothetical protein
MSSISKKVWSARPSFISKSKALTIRRPRKSFRHLPDQRGSRTKLAAEQTHRWREPDSNLWSHFEIGTAHADQHMMGLPGVRLLDCRPAGSPSPRACLSG